MLSVQLRKEIVSDLSSLVSPVFRQSGDPAAVAASPQNLVVHPMVACDVCDRPIVGVRYKCG